MAELKDAIDSGDYRDSLVAIRNYLVHELEGNRCKTCAMSQLRTGDTAAIVLRLQKVIDDIEAIPEKSGEVTRLESIRGRRDGSGSPEAEDSALAKLGTKAGARRQGGRRPRLSDGA